MPIKIELRPNETAASAMRKLKKICEKEGVIKELKKHAFYEKPSVIRRRNKIRTQKQIKKDKAEQQQSL